MCLKFVCTFMTSTYYYMTLFIRPHEKRNTLSGRTGSALAWRSEGRTFAAH